MVLDVVAVVAGHGIVAAGNAIVRHAVGTAWGSRVHKDVLAPAHGHAWSIEPCHSSSRPEFHNRVVGDCASNQASLRQRCSSHQFPNMRAAEVMMYGKMNAHNVWIGFHLHSRQTMMKYTASAAALLARRLSRRFLKA